MPRIIEGNEEDDGVTCMHCGAEDCYWQSKWNAQGVETSALFKDGKPHVCAPNADDFEAVP